MAKWPLSRAKAKAEPTHITDKAGAKIAQASQAVTRTNDTVPGPSTNPATNLLVTELLLRSIGRITRHSLSKGLLNRRYSPDFAKDAVEKRSLIQTLTLFGATRIATRSLPGAALVWGGLLAKTLYDRRQSRRMAERSGDLTLKRQVRRSRRR